MTERSTKPALAGPRELGIQIERDKSLAPLTTMKIGGPADYFATVHTTDQLLKLVRWAHAVALPYFMLGGGSNSLISDAGIRGLVIENRCRQVRVDEAPCCQVPRDEGCALRAGAPCANRPYLMAESGAAMAGAARVSVRAGLSGLEWGVSVPGTVGGAVVGNAGAHGGEIKDSLEDVLLLDEHGDVQEYTLADFEYSYRDSAIKRLQPLVAGFKPVILNANFRLVRGESAAIAQRAERFLNHRRQTQPVEPSLGSTFVNPPGDYAGRLIEAAGLKGTRVGGVEVSRLHANFMINPGGVGKAKARDVIQLIEQIETVVAERCGVHLVREIQLVGEW